MFCLSEHAYQFHKCKFAGDEDAASAVLHSATPKLEKLEKNWKKNWKLLVRFLTMNLRPETTVKML